MYFYDIVPVLLFTSDAHDSNYCTYIDIMDRNDHGSFRRQGKAPVSVLVWSGKRELGGRESSKEEEEEQDDEGEALRGV